CSQSIIKLLFLILLIIPVQKGPPAKNKRLKRNIAVLPPTARAPLYCTPSVYKLSKHLERGPQMERAAPPRRGGPRSRLGDSGDEKGEKSVEKEEAVEIEVVADLEGAPESSEAPNIALFNGNLVSKDEPNLPKMMEQMTQLMGNFTKAVSTRDNSRAPEFTNTSMKAPDCFDGTHAHKLRGFIQSHQLIFHNDPKNFFPYRKKVLHSTSILTGRA
ncbi:hypothetical protein O181_086924, partial [Austropuccinia psidii MF-1]|nr:hypothetical protein [Austropuccinia psidii MF-1]